MSSNLLRCMSVAILIAALAHTIRAQTDVIRGRVTDDSSHGLAATVMVTRGPDRLTQQPRPTAPATTASLSSRGPATTSCTSRLPVQRRAAVSSDKPTSTSSSPTSCSARTSPCSPPSKVTADRAGARHQCRRSHAAGAGRVREVERRREWTAPAHRGRRPQRDRRHDAQRHHDAERPVDPRAPAPSPTSRRSMAWACRPASIPRAARTETRVTGATFDATRGGFAGANVDVRLGPGNRSYQQRNAFFTLRSAVAAVLGSHVARARRAERRLSRQLRCGRRADSPRAHVQHCGRPRAQHERSRDAARRARPMHCSARASPDSVARLVASRRARPAARQRRAAGRPSARGGQLARPLRRHARHARHARAHDVRSATPPTARWASAPSPRLRRRASGTSRRSARSSRSATSWGRAVACSPRRGSR